MTNEELIAKIKAEIERLKEHTAKCGYPGQDEYAEGNKEGRNFICDKLLSFLSTLESEKPMNMDEELNEEIKKEMVKLPFFIRGKDQIAFARHFAEWGAKYLSNPSKAMEIDIEKECGPYTEMLYVPALSSELNSALKTLSRCYLYNFGCHIRNLILGIPEDNKEIEKLADDICKSIFEKQ